MKHLYTLVLVVLFGTNTLSSNDDFKLQTQENWHQFRGPLANGTAPKAKPPTEWSETKNVKWKYDIPGVGSSTPIVWNDRVFITSAIKRDKIDESITPPEKQPKNGFFDIKYPNSFYKFEIICVDRKSGKKIWQKTAIEAVPAEGRHPDNNFASATPTTDGQNLFVSFGSQGFYCYSLDGEFKWKRTLGKVKTRNNFGEGASLTYHDKKLIIVRDNETNSSITVVDSDSGKTVWESKRDEPSCWATPIVVEHKGVKQLITNGHTQVRSYNLNDGKLIWFGSGQVMNVTPSPVIFGTDVICMSGYRGNVAMSIDIDSKGDVRKEGNNSVNWEIDKGTPYIPSPALYENRLYFTRSNANVLSCVDPKSGKPIFEQTRITGIRSMYSSPTAADGKVYFVGRDGTTVVLKAADKYEELATNKVDDKIDASPVLVGNEIFLRGRDKLYCIGRE